MNILMTIFMIIWIMAALCGVFNPQILIKRFKTVAKIIQLEEASDKNMLFFQIVMAFFALVGFFILWMIFSGNVSFNP
ncbi:MAG: putative membrane protein [Candidatus Omnitrophota bacterium]|jgi:uncharacterized membrane protein